MRKLNEGGYDAWGVRLPNGNIREFSTQEKAARFVRAMEGRDVIGINGDVTTWNGLTVVTRFIPSWSEVDLP